MLSISYNSSYLPYIVYSPVASDLKGYLPVVVGPKRNDWTELKIGENDAQYAFVTQAVSSD